MKYLPLVIWLLGWLPVCKYMNTNEKGTSENTVYSVVAYIVWILIAYLLYSGE